MTQARTPRANESYNILQNEVWRVPSTQRSHANTAARPAANCLAHCGMPTYKHLMSAGEVTTGMSIGAELSSTITHTTERVVQKRRW